LGQIVNARHDAGGGNGDMAHADLCRLVQDMNGSHGVLVIQHGFALPHKDDVADFLAAVALNVQILLDNFGNASVPHEAQLSGGAETAVHGASNLSAETHRVGSPFLKVHEHRLHHFAVGQPEEVLGGAVRAD